MQKQRKTQDTSVSC